MELDPDWQLVYDSGALYRLYNTSAETATDVQLRASLLQLDGMGSDYIRRIPAVESEDFISLQLRQVWGGTDPRLLVSWTRDGQELQKTIRL